MSRFHFRIYFLTVLCSLIDDINMTGQLIFIFLTVLLYDGDIAITPLTLSIYCANSRANSPPYENPISIQSLFLVISLDIPLSIIFSS